MTDRTIEYDNKFGGFYVRETVGPNSKEFKPIKMSDAGYLKTLEVHVLVVREMETESYEQQKRTIFYDLPLTYKIEGKNSEEFFLVKETTRDPSDRLNRVYARVFLKDADTGGCQMSPMPNQLFQQDTFPWLTITKGKARIIEKEEITELLTNGTCLGIFDSTLTNRRVQY